MGEDVIVEWYCLWLRGAVFLGCYWCVVGGGRVGLLFSVVVFYFYFWWNCLMYI